MRIIVAGPRDFKDYYFVAGVLEHFFQNLGDVEIVHGDATGVDTFARIWAEEHVYRHTEFEAKWDRYGRSAGPIRNRDMALYAEALLAIWDGESRGTKNMIETAGIHGLKTKITYI